MIRGRDVVIDAARLVATIVIVASQVLLWRPTVGADGQLTSGVLAPGPLGWALSWLALVQPAFFIVSGFGHAMSIERLRTAGGTYADFLLSRGRHVVVPLALFVGAGALISTAALWIGEPVVAQVIGTQFAAPLWFVSVSVVSVIAAPILLRAWDRYRALALAAFLLLGVIVSLLAVPLADATEWNLDLRTALLFVVYPACYTMGMALQRGWLMDHPGTAAIAVVVGVAVVAMGAFGRVWPPAAFGFADAPGGNLLPPTLAVMALGVAQAGVLALLRHAWGTRTVGAWWARRLRAGSMLAVTVFLWHVPVIALYVALAQALSPDRATTRALFHPLTMLLLAGGLVYLLAPLLRAVAQRLTPPVRVARPALTLAACLVALAGSWVVWQNGVLVHPLHPWSTLGVLAVMVGLAMLVGATNGIDGGPAADESA